MGTEQRYIPGSFYRICQRSGFAVRADKTRWEWDNLIVRDQSWEPRQPQDFVRGVRDDQNVPMPLPRTPNTYVGPLVTSINSAAVLGDTTIVVASTTGMANGNSIGVILDNGINQETTISSVLSSTGLILNAPLQWSAAVGNAVIDNSAITQPYIG